MQFDHATLHTREQACARLYEQEKFSLVLDRVAPSIDRAYRPHDIDARRQSLFDKMARDRMRLSLSAGRDQDKSRLREGHQEFSCAGAAGANNVLRTMAP